MIGSRSACVDFMTVLRPGRSIPHDVDQVERRRSVSRKAPHADSRSRYTSTYMRSIGDRAARYHSAESRATGLGRHPPTALTEHPRISGRRVSDRGTNNGRPFTPQRSGCSSTRVVSVEVPQPDTYGSGRASAAALFVGVGALVYVEAMSARCAISVLTVAAVLAAGCSENESTDNAAAASATPTASTPQSAETDPPATEPDTTDPLVTEPVETDPPPEPEVSAAAERAPYDFSGSGRLSMPSWPSRG